jgi:hypothetical protein
MSRLSASRTADNGRRVDVDTIHLRAVIVDGVVEVWEPREPRSRGLGDTIAKVTKAIGVRPCGGCNKRQEALNRLVPYK